MIEFKGWSKTPRLFRDITITEKIDGTNSAVIVLSENDVDEEIVPGRYYGNQMGFGVCDSDGNSFIVGAQSRNRLINPDSDNFGFAAWVRDNMRALVATLGPGYHYGEWWGSGVQRGYGLTKGEKRFSLFNVHRYDYINTREPDDSLPALDVVPVLYQGPNDQVAIEAALIGLRNGGSWAAPGFDRPEGIVVFHSASRQVYKVLLENDELPKGLAA